MKNAHLQIISVALGNFIMILHMPLGDGLFFFKKNQFFLIFMYHVVDSGTKYI